MDYLKKSRIEEVLIAILGKGTVTSQLISRIEKILDAIRVKGSYDGIVMSEVEEILVCILLGERFEKPTHSRIAAMLKVKANGGEYTELRKSRVEDLIFEWINAVESATYTGTLPATLRTVRGYLVSYKIYGNAIQAGTPTPENPIVPSWCGELETTGVHAGQYKLPILSNSAVTNIYLGESQTTRRIGKRAMTGNEVIAKNSSSATNYLFYMPRSTLTGSISKTSIVCDRLQAVVEPPVAQIGINTNNNYNVVYFNFGADIMNAQPSGNTIDGLKEYLAAQYATGTPVTIWYVLAEPETAVVNEPLMKIGDYADTIDSTQTTAQIPTFAGETIVDYGIAALPHAAGLDGIFEYGDIDGQTWKNSVSGEKDITFDTAVTDTGAEYVLPAGATGQYTSKSGEYRTAFTWYCVAKCPTTCYTAGQYMISNWNNQGVEISSGWAAYSSAGANHLVRSMNNNDFNSAEAVTSYALIVVSGDVNGVASVYVNGVKMTDSWNFNPVPSDRADTIFLGKRASGQLSGTDIDYKFLAFGITKQTDAEITANSQYLMTKYLGVGKPEKVELTYKTP